MPQRVNCHQCGYILYQGQELKSPEDILQIYDGKCPKCGVKLSLAPLNINVEEASNKTSPKFFGFTEK